MRVYVFERVFDFMRNMGMDEETEFFEEVLHSVVGFVCDHHVYGLDETLLGRGQRLKWTKIKARYPDGQCREHFPTDTEVFMGWKMAMEEQVDEIWKLNEVLQELVLVAGGAKGEWESENGVSTGKAAGAGAAAADAAESAGDADVPGDGAAGGRCAESEAGAAEAEYMDYGAEDEEETADWIPGTIADGPAGERGGEMGLSGQGPGEASDKTGRVERRKKSFGSLPPMSKYRTSLYAESVCR